MQTGNGLKSFVKQKASHTKLVSQLFPNQYYLQRNAFEESLDMI